MSKELLRSVKAFLNAEKPRLNSFGVAKIGVFGSVVRGEERPDSDIDVLIDIQPDSTLTLFSLIALEQEYSERLHRKVDLVIQADLRPEIGRRILQEVQYV